MIQDEIGQVGLGFQPQGYGNRALWVAVNQQRTYSFICQSASERNGAGGFGNAALLVADHEFDHAGLRNSLPIVAM